MSKQAPQRAREMEPVARMAPDRSRASEGTVLQWRLPPAVELVVQPGLARVPDRQIGPEQKMMEQLVPVQALSLPIGLDKELVEEPALARVLVRSIGLEQKMMEQLVPVQALSLAI